MGARGQRPDLSSCWLAPFLELQCFCYLWPVYQSSQESLTLMLWIWTHRSPPPPMTVPMAGQTRADATVWTLQINLEFKGNKLIFTATQQVGAQPRKSRIPKHSHSSSGVLPSLLVSLHSTPISQEQEPRPGPMSRAVENTQGMFVQRMFGGYEALSMC